MLNEELVMKALRRTWQPVAICAELKPGTVTSFTLLNTELVLTRFTDGRALAADVACPHKGARLALGKIAANCLVCPYHGWEFTSSGSCAEIPSLVDPSPEKLALSRLNRYETQERYGMLWVKLEPSELKLPDVPEFEDPAWTFVMGPATPFASGWRREVENYLDMTHFAFAHADTLGKAADSKLPPMDVRPNPDGGFQMDAAFPSLAAPSEKPTKLQSAHHRHQRGYLPNFTTIHQRFEGGDTRVLVHIPSPNTAESCTVFWALAISPGFIGPPPEAQLQFAIRVLEEDRLMCENQRPREVPINPSRGGWGVLVMPGDSLANLFQKQLRRWLSDQFDLREEVASDVSTQLGR